MTGAAPQIVNLTEVAEMLRIASERCAALDQTVLPSPQRHKDRVAALASVQRDSLYLAHLLDRARILTLDEYHSVRGFTDHLPTEEQP